MGILEIKSVTKRYGNEIANNEITLSVERGEIYGLIGENGAGKTTLIRQIAGLASSDEGKITCNSVNGIGIALDPGRLDPDMTAQELLDTYIAFTDGKTGRFSKELLEYVGLQNEKKKIGKFSLGMKQRLLIATAIIGYPELVILDEPTNGLDPIGIRDMREKIKHMNEELGITFLISSHNLGELVRIADRYGVLCKGRLVKEIRVEELKDMNEDQRELFFIRAMEGREA